MRLVVGVPKVIGISFKVNCHSVGQGISAIIPNLLQRALKYSGSRRIRVEWLSLSLNLIKEGSMLHQPLKGKRTVQLIGLSAGEIQLFVDKQCLWDGRGGEIRLETELSHGAHTVVVIAAGRFKPIYREFSVRALELSGGSNVLRIAASGEGAWSGGLYVPFGEFRVFLC